MRNGSTEMPPSVWIIGSGVNVNVVSSVLLVVVEGNVVDGKLDDWESVISADVEDKSGWTVEEDKSK